MKLVTLIDIQELAQEFNEKPYFETVENGCKLVFDYETETGGYKKKFIQFTDVYQYNFIPDGLYDAEFIKSYNKISKILDSKFIKNNGLSRVYNHFVIYFDGFGLYEIVAKSFEYSPSNRNQD